MNRRHVDAALEAFIAPYTTPWADERERLERALEASGYPAEVERLRETLAFYADERDDGGMRAREALGDG